ncbi:MAG: hypothetical protein QM493_02495 [Sulfurovum sp.]
MKYIYVVVATLMLILMGYSKYISDELNDERVNKKVGKLEGSIYTKTVENNLTSISSEAIGRLKQIEKDSKNEKKPPDTIGTHTYTFE